MAILKNTANDIHLILDLKKTNEFPEWIGYELKVFIHKDDSSIEFLRFKYPDQLYFDNSVEPEVSGLYESLEALINEIISIYIFEPIDEKDFRLEINNNGQNRYRLNLFFQEATVFDCHAWNVHAMIGLQMIVDKESLLAFSNELRKEHLELKK